MLFNCGISVFLFLYNPHLLDPGFGGRSMGILTGAMVLGSMLGTLPMGWMAGRYGLRPVLAGSLVLAGAAYAARVCVFWMPAQLLSSFVSGILLCGWMVCVSPLYVRRP